MFIELFRLHSIGSTDNVFLGHQHSHHRLGFELDIGIDEEQVLILGRHKYGSQIVSRLMNEWRLHGVNTNFDPALTELLHEFDNRQHRADLYRVVARHGNVNTWFHNEPQCAAMMFKGLESDGASALGLTQREMEFAFAPTLNFNCVDIIN